LKPLCAYTEKGLYCEQGNFFIDPIKPVDRALITHAHADHARKGHKYYLAQTRNREILKLRLGKKINLELLDYNQPLIINGIKVSFHSAGHIWGSAQIRLEYKGEIWVISGDYKRENDGFSGAFEPVVCHTFVTESTFGLPEYIWPKQEIVIKKINDWWKKNALEGKSSVIKAYALGKAQRLIHSLDHGIGKIFVHPNIHLTNEALKADGAILPATNCLSWDQSPESFAGKLIITSSLQSGWQRKFEPFEQAQVSGWVLNNGIHNEKTAKGFVLSDHADWNGLNETVTETQAERVFVMHGYTVEYSNWLNSKGIEALELNNLN
jgi:putative mRNA 3-end processing factor